MSVGLRVAQDAKLYTHEWVSLVGGLDNAERLPNNWLQSVKSFRLRHYKMGYKWLQKRQSNETKALKMLCVKLNWNTLQAQEQAEF